MDIEEFNEEEDGRSIPDRDYHFWHDLAAFAYADFMENGRGAVMIKQIPVQVMSTVALDKSLMYISLDLCKRTFPEQSTEMIECYCPTEEAVLLILDGRSNLICLLLNETNFGETPEEAYETVYGHSRFTSGELLRLPEELRGIEAGHYVFLRREGPYILVCRAGLDPEGNLCRTKRVERLHVDYDATFETVGGIMVPKDQV